MRITKPIERWFPAVDDPDESEHLIRHLTPGEEEDVYAENSSQETRYTQNDKDEIVPEIIQKSNIGSITNSTRAKAIVDWKNMFDENGDLMDCTEENKSRALREIEGYREFIDDCRVRLKKDIKEEKAVLEKN